MPSDTSVIDYTSKEAQSNAFNKKMIKLIEAREDSKLEYLPYGIGYLTDELREMAENELNETEERKEKCLKKFRQLIAAEKNLFVRTDDLCLLAYLRGKKYDVEKAFKSMQNTYKLRMKKRFYDADDNTVVHDVFRQNWIGFLPYRAKNGSVILVVKVGMWDTEKVDRDLFMWVLTHCMIHSIEDPATQVAGYTAIVDVRGVGNKHLRMLTIENIMLLIYSTQIELPTWELIVVLFLRYFGPPKLKFSLTREYFCLDSKYLSHNLSKDDAECFYVELRQSCFPGRYKAIHVIGMPKFFQYAYNMVYPFIMNLKLRKRIFIHGDDLKSLHKQIPQTILPEEFGGKLGPFDNSAWHASILANNEWCLEQRIYGYQKPQKS